MTTRAANELTRASLVTMHRMLLAGLVVIWLAIGGMTWAGVVPLLPENTLLGRVIEGIAAIDLLAAWFWARPRVPRRQPLANIDTYWGNEKTLRAASLVLFLFEGSAILGAVCTMLSASPIAAVISFAAILGLAFNGPERLERPAL